MNKVLLSTIYFVIGILLFWHVNSFQNEKSHGSLIKQLSSNEPVVRRRAAFHLCSKLKHTPSELKIIKSFFLNDSDKYVRTWCGLILARELGSSEPLITFFCNLLEEKEVWFVVQGASGLERLGEKASTAMPALLRAHERDEPEIKIAISLTFLAIGKNAKAAVPLLINNLKNSPEPVLKAYSAEALGAIGESAEDAVPPLVELLNNKMLNEFEVSVIIGLGGIGPKAKLAIPRLITYLNHKKSYITINALNSLSAIAPDDPIVVRKIMEKLEDPRSEVRFYAVNALGKAIKMSDDVVVRMAKLLNDNEEEIAIKVLNVLREYRTDLALTVIRSATKSKNTKIKKTAQEILKNIRNH